MAQSDITARTLFWQEQVTAWQASGLTQKAYCQERALQHSTFGYWVRKLRAADTGSAVSPSGFVPITLASPVGAGLALALPNGLEIRGIEADNLALVRQLLGVLA